MNFLIVIFLLITAEIFLVPLYVKKSMPGKNKISLLLKMICSAIFILTAVCAVLYSGHTGAYAKAMLTGFVLSFAGDFFLHVSNKKSSFAIGFVCFLFAHISYISAYSLAISENYGEGQGFAPQAAAVAVIFIAVCIFSRNIRLEPEKIKIPIALYALVLITMFVKASALGVMLFADKRILGAVLPVLGAVLFMVSDSTLVFLYFAGKKSFALKFINSTTYFASQLMLASSILFVK